MGPFKCTLLRGISKDDGEEVFEAKSKQVSVKEEKSWVSSEKKGKRPPVFFVLASSGRTFFGSRGYRVSVFTCQRGLNFAKPAEKIVCREKEKC